MSSWDEDICDEIETLTEDGPSGRRIVKYRPTERAKKELQKRREAFLAVRRPQLQLDPELFPLVTDRTLNDPPVLHYGFIFPRKEINKLVARYKLTIGNGQPMDDYDRATYSRLALQKYIWKKFRYDLRITDPFSASEDVCMIALDDTLRLRCAKSKSWAREAQPVVKRLCKELGLEPGTRPKWYLSCCRDELYTCSLPKYNPPQVNLPRFPQLSPFGLAHITVDARHLHVIDPEH